MFAELVGNNWKFFCKGITVGEIIQKFSPASPRVKFSYCATDKMLYVIKMLGSGRRNRVKIGVIVSISFGFGSSPQ